MKPSHPVYVLTSALLHYASKARSNLGKFNVCDRVIMLQVVVDVWQVHHCVNT